MATLVVQDSTTSVQDAELLHKSFEGINQLIIICTYCS